MFPSYKQSQQLLEKVDALIGGAVVKLAVLTLPMVLRIEAHVLEHGVVIGTTAFSARRANGEVLWSFFSEMTVDGVVMNRGDTTSRLGARLRIIPRAHADRGYSLCDGPLVDYLICVRRNKVASPKHRCEQRDELYVYYPLMAEVMVFRYPQASHTVKVMGAWRALACATTITTKNGSELEGQQ
jgi:hypothetical protein